MTVCVVGGGPAGLSAAIHAARAGAAVVLLERNDRCGAKLLTTGGGRCNVSNALPGREWPDRFGRRGRFIQPALARLPLATLLSLLAEIGQPAELVDGFHHFPQSASARAVRDALLREAARLGVDVRTGKRCSGLRLESGRVTGVMAGGECIPCDAAIVATGGRSYPATGSTGDGWPLAEGVGHRIAPAFPGLVGLRAGNLSADLAGLVLPDAAVSIKVKGSAALRGGGELLLTHGGVSGPAVLDLSASLMRALEWDEKGGPAKTAALAIRWCADAEEASWRQTFLEWRDGRGSSPLPQLLRERLPLRLARWLCAYAGVTADTTAATLRSTGRDALAAALGAFPARITGCEGWDRAMITRGGVDVREVDPRTLESERADGLFFAGEVLDMDGPCGGYNLHWAFASGALAGDGAAVKTGRD